MICQSSKQYIRLLFKLYNSAVSGLFATYDAWKFTSGQERCVHVTYLCKMTLRVAALMYNSVVKLFWTE